MKTQYIKMYGMQLTKYFEGNLYYWIPVLQRKKYLKPITSVSKKLANNFKNNNKKERKQT